MNWTFEHDSNSATGRRWVLRSADNRRLGEVFLDAVGVFSAEVERGRALPLRHRFTTLGAGHRVNSTQLPAVQAWVERHVRND